MTGLLAAHRGVAVSVAANPVTVTALQAGSGKKGRRAVDAAAEPDRRPGGRR